MDYTFWCAISTQKPIILYYKAPLCTVLGPRVLDLTTWPEQVRRATATKRRRHLLTNNHKVKPGVSENTITRPDDLGNNWLTDRWAARMPAICASMMLFLWCELSQNIWRRPTYSSISFRAINFIFFPFHIYVFFHLNYIIIKKLKADL